VELVQPVRVGEVLLTHGGVAIGRAIAGTAPRATPGTKPRRRQSRRATTIGAEPPRANRVHPGCRPNGVESGDGDHEVRH
jgi:hypothetical protein